MTLRVGVEEEDRAVRRGAVVMSTLVGDNSTIGGSESRGGDACRTADEAAVPTELEGDDVDAAAVDVGGDVIDTAFLTSIGGLRGVGCKLDSATATTDADAVVVANEELD